MRGEFSQESFERIFMAMTRDNPLIYFLNQSACSTASDMFEHIAICPQYFFTKEKVKEYNRKIDKDMGFRLKKARLDQKLTYDELSEKSGVSSRYIKEIENHGNVPSLEKLGQLIRALHISADPFFYPAAPTDNLDYQRLLVYLSECTNDQITTILALVEAYLRTYKTHETE